MWPLYVRSPFRRMRAQCPEQPDDIRNRCDGIANRYGASPGGRMKAKIEAIEDKLGRKLAT